MTDYAKLSDAELMAMYKKAKDPFESALAAEGVSGPVAEIARSIYQQESGSGKNTKTSNAGAVGGMQIIPGTFKSVADKDWDINDPTQNARAGIRYVKQLHEKAGGDPALTAAGYYGGPGGLEKARRGVADSDPRNPNAPTTLQYGQQVAARLPKEPLNPVMAAGKAVTDAVIPSANAAEVPQASPYSSMSDDDLLAAYKKLQGDIPRVEVTGTSADEPGILDQASGALNTARQFTNNIGMGAVRGAGSIGATILAPYDMAMDAISGDQQKKLSDLITGRKLPPTRNQQRRADMDAALTSLGADTNSLGFQGGKLAGEIAGTAGVGTAIAAPLKAAGIAPRLAAAIQSGGMTVGQGGAPATNLLARVAGGAISGGASAGLVNPEDAKMGAMIGGALPVATKVAGWAGNKLGKAISGGQLTPEVKALADRAQQLGIDIPADRLVNSKPLNALAASLDYVPFSGRAGTMDKMQSQLNTALSKTFGQNSDNVTGALRKAQTDLGSKFDTVLKSNTVRVDQQLMTDLADAANMASKELGSDGAKIIANQVDEIIAKGANGDIDGQAAYNIKRTLDRISQRNSPEAFYARDLKQKLMAALDRSLGPQQAAEFAQVRKQYGNMLSLENLAQNGADGNISIARLANMKNINNHELQELADISAQFLKGREGQHGAAQRAVAGLGLGGVAGVPALAGSVAAGRGANMLLNSSVMKNAVTGSPQTNQMMRLLGEPEAQQFLYRSAPVAIRPQ
jgi:hypothetical protein